MGRRSVGVVALAVLLFAPVPARGDESASAVEKAADAAVAASKGSDVAALKAIATAETPDPWEVVDELLGRRRPGGAAGVAGASDAYDVRRLPEYVSSRASEPTSKVRATLTDARKALADG